MALSYYSNWGTPTITNTSTTNNILFSQEPQLSQDLLLPPELLNFSDNFDTCIDPLFTQTNLICYSDEYVSSYATVSPPLVPLNTIPPPLEMFDEEPCVFHQPKHMKFQENFNYYPDNITIHNSNNYEMGFVPNPPMLPEFISPDFISPEFPIPLPTVFNEGIKSESSSSTSNVKKTGSLSQQSIAARLRRRKITEKTQELGKLIPGGQKMNTAEMFQAASKYIKFLQAQVGILQLMQEENDEEGMQSPELEALVTSPLIQEKLYSAEKCLVPRNFVKSLTQKPQLQSNSQLIKDLIKLL